MSEENKRIARRIQEEVWTLGNLDALDELYSPDFFDATTAPRQSAGLEGLKRSIAGYRRAFPNSRSIVEDQIAE
ncbi:MAG: ester cyclase, partial [Dehalococcoidia bacterium]|nr:ester cyclase [Dehalococcoidia bacterium]